MKQIFSRVLLLILITAAILGLSSCTIFFEQEEDIYRFDSSRFDREVVFGEELDLDSLSIEVFGSDGVKKKTLTVTESMVIKGDTDTIGDHELVIEYGGERWTVMYTVFYEIKFTVPDDQTQSSTQLVSSVDEIIMPDDPAISGSTFIGWSKKIPAELTGNMELFAIFADRITIPKFEATYGDKLSSLDLPEVNDAKWEWVDDPDTTFVGNATEGRSPNSFQILYIPNNDELDPIEFTTTVSVKKKTLTFTLPTSVEYDPDAQKYNFLGMYTLTGFVAGEEDYKPRVILLGDNNVSEIGKYSYTLGVADSNYRGDYVGYFEITPIKITIDVIWKSGKDVETIIYGGQLPEYEYKVMNKDGNEYTEFLSSDLKVTVHTPVLEVGTYYLTATLSDEVADDIDYTKYYSVNVNYAKLVVESKVMDPGDPKLAEEYVIYFGDTLSEIQFAYHPNGSWAWVDDPSTTVGNVGENKFKAQFTPFSDNYDAPEPVWISLTVLPKELSFRITSPTRVIYDGQPHNLTYEIIDLETGEKFDKELVVLGNDSYIDASATPYGVTLVFEDTNYLAKNNSFNITIDKASPEIASPSISGTWKPGMKVSDLDISGVENDGLAGAFTWNNGGQPVDMPGNYEYYATFTPSDSKNYSPVGVKVLASVDKATPKFESNVTEYTGLRFNDGNYVLKNVISTTSDNSKGNVKFLLSDGTEITYLKNAGTYTVTVIVEADKEGYYKEIRKTVTVTIDKVDPVISLDIDNWTYGSAAKQPVADCNAIGNYEIGIAGYEYRLVGSSEWIDFTSASYPTKAGKYELRALVSEGANHNSGISETVTFTIDKQVVTVPTIASMTYNKGIQYPNVSSTALYTVATKGTAGNMGGQDVNKYYVTLTLVDGDNYKWPGTESLTYEASYDITKALVNVIADFNGGEWTYNGTAQVNHSTTSDFGEVKYTYYYVSGSNRILVEKDDIVNAGNYLVVASVAGNNNYVAATSVEKSFTIKKAVVSRPVLNSDSFEFNGQLIKPTIVDNNATNKTLYYVSRNTGNTNVGENYEVILTIDASKFDNYRWEGQADDQRTLTLTYDITQAVVNIDSASQSDWTYLDSTILPVIKINKSFSVNYKYEYRLVGTENWTEIAPSDSGNYEVRITVLDDASGNANYVGGDNKSKVLTFTINPKSYDLDVTVNGGIYNKTDLTSGLSGVAGIYTVTDSGDAVTVAGKGTPAGTYTVTFTLVKTDDGVYNYVWGTLPTGAVKSSDGTTVTISYTIEQKSVAKPTFITKSFTYDLVNGAAKDYEVTAAQLNNFNAEYMTITCDKQNQAGNNYTATITLDSNYKWNDGDTSRTATVIWSINKAKAEIDVDTTTITKVFGQTVTLPTATTKFGTVECNTVASSLVNKGEYTVTYTVADTDNYYGDTETVKVIINKATVTVSGISIIGWTYGLYNSTSNKPTFTSAETSTGVDVSGYVTFEYSENGVDGWTTDVPENAGTYYLRAKVSASEHGNWDETCVKASETFKIAKKGIAAPDIDDLRYNGTLQYPDISDKDGWYTVAVKGTDGNKGIENVGSQFVTLTLTDEKFKNYKWKDEDETKQSTNVYYNVTKATPSIYPGFDANEDGKYGKTYDRNSLAFVPTAKAGDYEITTGIDIKYYQYILKNGKYEYDEISAPTNVGKYYIRVTVAAGENWNANNTGYIEYVISPDKVIAPEITGSSEYYYDNTAKYPAISTPDGYTIKWYEIKTENGETVENPITDKATIINVGKYKVVISLNDAKNYVWSDTKTNAPKTFEYEIKQNTVSVTDIIFKNGEITLPNTWVFGTNVTVDQTVNKTFDDVTFTYKYEYKLSSEGDDKYVEWTEASYPKNVGEYSIRVTVNGNENYAGVSCVETVTITQATETPTVSTPGDFASKPGNPEFVQGDSENNDKLVLDYIPGNTAFNVEEYITVTLDTENVVESNREIDRIVITKKSSAYSLRAATVTGTLDSVGEYTVTYYFKTNDNYTDVSVTITVIIEAKSIADVIEGETTKPTVNVNFSYDSTVFNNDFQTQSISITTVTGNVDLVAGTDFTWTIKNSAGQVVKADEIKHADTYTVTIEGMGNYTGSVVRTFTVEKANVSITGTPSSITGKPYDASIKYLENLLSGVVVKYTNGTANGTETDITPDVNVVYVPVVGTAINNYTGDITNAGKYTITYTYAGDDNFNAAATVTVTVEIDQITETFSNDYLVQFNNKTYGDKLPKLPTSNYGEWKWLNADKTEADADTTVGSATASGKYNTFYAVFTPSDANANNYSENSITVNITVKQDTVTIHTAPDDSNEYRSEGYDISSLINPWIDEDAAATFEFYVDGEKVTEPLKDAKTYIVKVILVHSNYAAETTVSVTIQKSTASAKDVEKWTNGINTKTYGDTLASFGNLPTSSYGEWKWLNADKVEVNADNTTVGNATTGEEYNVFYLYFKSNSSNYADITETVRIKVNKAKATVNATANASKEYISDGYDISSLITAGATINGNAINGADFLYYVDESTISQTKLYDAKTYSVKVVLDHENYEADVAIVEVTIDKQKVTVPTVNTAAKETYVYTIDGGIVKKHTLVLDNFNDLMKYDDAEGASVSVVEATDAGTYYVYVVLKDTANFKWASDFDGVIEIEWKVEKATINKPAKLYAEYAAGRDVITSQLHDTELYTVQYGTSVSTIGTYEATLTLTESAFKNYKWNTTDEDSVVVEYEITEKLVEWTVSGLDGWEFGKEMDTYEVSARYGDEHAFTITKVEFKHEKSSEWTTWDNNNYPEAAGKYEIRFTSSADASYSGAVKIKEITITQATASLPVSSIAGKEYDGNGYNTELTLGSNGVYTISGDVTNNGDAKEYSVTFTLNPDESIAGVYNYKWSEDIKTTADGKVVVSTDGKSVTLNYSITSATVNVTGVTLDKKSWTYGEGSAAITPATDKTFTNVTFSYTYTFYKKDANGEYKKISGVSSMSELANNQGYVDAGYYKVEASVNGNSNYESGTSAYVEFEVKQAHETINFNHKDGASGTFTDGVLTLTYRESGYSISDLISVQLKQAEIGNITVPASGRTNPSVSVTYVKNAGTYEVVYTYAATANYAEVTGKITVVIDPKPVNIVPGNLEKPYDGTHQYSGLTTNSEYTVEDAGLTNVGTWTVTITLNNTAEAINYKWADGVNTNPDGTVTFTYEIVPIDLDVSVVVGATNNTKVYDTTAMGITTTVKYVNKSLDGGYAFVSSDDVTVLYYVKNAEGDYVLYGTNGKAAPTDVGEYAIRIVVAEAQNYNKHDNVDENGNVTEYDATFSITAKEVTVDLGSEVTNGTLNLTYNDGKSFDLTTELGATFVDATGTPIKDGINYYMMVGEVLTDVTSGYITNHGEYTVTIKLDNANYTVTNTSELTITVKVAKKGIDLPGYVENLDYIGMDQTPTITHNPTVVGDIVYKDLYVVTYKNNGANRNVGTYGIYFKLKDEAFKNYKWNGYDENVQTVEDKTYKINRVDPTVSVVVNDDDKTKPYDSSVMSVTVTVTVPEATLVEGTNYTVYYYVKNEEGNYVLYGTDGKTAPTNVGEYAIRVVVTGGEGYNWNARELTGDDYDATFKIEQATVNLGGITVSDKTYNGSNQTSGLTAGTGYTVTDVGGTNVGDYTVTFKLESDNYKWGTIPSHITSNGDGTYSMTYNITAASITDATVTLGSTSAEYTGNDLAPTVTVQITLNGQLITLTDGTNDTDVEYTVTIKNSKKETVTKIVGVDTYTITVTGEGNYKDTAEMSKTFTVVKAKPYVSVEVNDDDKTKPYDNNPMDVDVNVEVPAVPSGDTTTKLNYTVYYYVKNAEDNYVLYGTDGKTAPTDVGDYAIRIVVEQSLYWESYNNVDKDGNVTKYDATFSITKRTITGATVSLRTGTLTDGKYVVTYANTDFYSSIIADGNITVTVDGLTATYGNVIIATDAAGTDRVTEVKNAGTYYVIVTGTGNFEGTAYATFEVKVRTVEAPEVEIPTVNVNDSSVSGYIYSGSSQYPTVTTSEYYTIKWYRINDDNSLTEITADLENGSKNVGNYKIVVTLDTDTHGNNIEWADGSVTSFEYSITHKNIEDKTGEEFDITISHTYSGLIYTGNPVTDRTVTVKWGDIKLGSADCDITIKNEKGETTVLNAGTYTITVTGKGNYTGTRSEVTFTVDPADTEFAVGDDITEEYSPTVSYNPLDYVNLYYKNTTNSAATLTSDNYTVKYVNTSGEDEDYTGEIKAAGTYTITYSFTATNNLNAPSGDNVLVITIGKIDPSVTIGEISSGAYRGTITPDITINGVTYKPEHVDYEKYVTITKNDESANEIKDVGNYVITLTYGDNNYNTVTTTKEISITPAAATISGTAVGNLVYSSNVIAQPNETTISGAITGIGAVIKDTATSLTGKFTYSFKHSYESFASATATADVIKNAGYYVVTINFVSTDGNYEGSTTVNVFVEKQSVTPSWTNPTYNGTAQSPTFTNNTANKTIIVFAKDAGTTYAPNVNVTGSYSAKVVLADPANYKWADDVENNNGIVTISWNILPATLDVKVEINDSNATNNTKVYDTTAMGIKVTVKHVNKTVEGGYTFVSTGVTVYYYVKNAEGNYVLYGTEAPTNAGDYAVYVIVENGTNYNGHNVGAVPTAITVADADATFSITPATVNVTGVTLNKTSWTYDGNYATITGITTDKTITGITFSYTYTFYKKDANGVYQLVSDADEMSDITDAGAYKVVVTLVSATANANGLSNYVAGDEAEKEFTISQKNITNKTGDAFDITITHTYNGKDNNGNPINLVYTGSVFSGNSYKVTVKYGNTTLDADDCTITITGVDKAGNNVTEVKNAGTYTITVTGKGNYTGTRNEITFTVDRAAATVSGEGASNLKFNDSNLATSTSNGTAIINVGAVIKDTTTALTGTFTYSFKHSNASYEAAKALAASNATEIKNAGYYVVTINFVSTDGNYEGSATVNVYVAKRTASDVLADVLATCTNTYYQYRLEELIRADDRFANGSDITFSYGTATNTVSTTGTCYQTLEVEVGNVKLNSSKFDPNNYDVTSSGSNIEEFKLYIVASLDEDSDNDIDAYYRTIEAALNASNSGDTVFVMPIIAVDSSDPITITKDCTIKSGVTLVLPYGSSLSDRNANGIHQVDMVDEKDSAGKVVYTRYSSINELECKTKVVLAEGRTINVIGTLEIAGEISGTGGGKPYAGHTARYYAELQMSEDSMITSTGTISCSGFITETYDKNGSEIIATGGIVYQPFVLRDFSGGSYMATVHLRGGKASAFNEFQFINIQSSLTVKYGATMKAWANLVAGSGPNHTEANVIGAASSDLIQLTDAMYSYLTANYNPDTDITDLDIYGGAKLNGMKMTINAGVLGDQSIDTANVFFPISWAFDISLNRAAEQSDNAEFTMPQSVKLMWGSKLIIEQGARLTVDELVIYDSFFISGNGAPQAYGCEHEAAACTDSCNSSWKRSPATCVVRGELVVNDNLGGKIYSDTKGAVVHLKGTNSSTPREVTSYSGLLQGNFGGSTISASLYTCSSITLSDDGTKYNISGQSGVFAIASKSRALYSTEKSKWVYSVKVQFVPIAGTAEYDSIELESESVLSNGATLTIPSVPGHTEPTAQFVWQGWQINGTTITAGSTITFSGEYVINAYGMYEFYETAGDSSTKVEFVTSVIPDLPDGITMTIPANRYYVLSNGSYVLGTTDKIFNSENAGEIVLIVPGTVISYSGMQTYHYLSSETLPSFTSVYDAGLKAIFDGGSRGNISYTVETISGIRYLPSIVTLARVSFVADKMNQNVKITYDQYGNISIESSINGTQEWKSTTYTSTMLIGREFTNFYKNGNPTGYYEKQLVLYQYTAVPKLDENGDPILNNDGTPAYDIVSSEIGKGTDPGKPDATNTKVTGGFWDRSATTETSTTSTIVITLSGIHENLYFGIAE